MSIIHRYHVDARDPAKVPMGGPEGGVIAGAGRDRYIFWGYEFKPATTERPDLRDTTL